MLNWYRNLPGNEKRTFWACYGGWTLDALDAQMFALVIPAITAAWHVSRAAAGSVAGATLAASACGGWIAGALADRYGRVRVLKATVACFSLFSLLSALTQNVPQLLVYKSLQGFGFGGEWAVGTVLLAEVMSPSHRGRALGVVQSGWAVGWGGAVLLYAGLSFLAPAQFAWRLLFAIGAVPALLLLYMQRSLREPQRTTVAAGAHSGFSAGAMLEIFSPGTLRLTLTGALLGLGAHGGYYALSTWLPTYLMSERHISVLRTSGYLGVIIASFWCGCVAASLLLDRLGRRRTILLFSVCCAAMVWIYLLIPISNWEMLWLGAPLGFFSAGIPASMGALFSEMYAASIRGAGVGFCYNFGRIVSALLPAVVGMLSASLPLGIAIGAIAGGAYLLVAIAVLILPERRRVVLETSVS
jgi:MFS family permease